MFYNRLLFCILSVVSTVLIQGCGKSEEVKAVGSAGPAAMTQQATNAPTEQLSRSISKEDLIGDWSALGGKGIIEVQADNSFKITNENKNVDSGKIVDGALHAQDWQVTGRLSLDKKSLIWSNGAVWKR